jgi:hypothetical protein
MSTMDLSSLDANRVVIGFLVSSLGGAIVLWLLIDKCAWPYLEKHGVSKKGKGALTLPLGICERVSYTAAFLLGIPTWIGVWLAIKVAAQWNRWTDEERATYNVFLIGNLLSIVFGFLGAWIALGQLPKLGAGDAG